MDAVPFDERQDDGYRLKSGSVDHAQSGSPRERSRHMCEHGFFIQPASGGARMDSREGSFAACLRKACWVALPRRLVASLRLFARSRAVHGRARRAARARRRAGGAGGRRASRGSRGRNSGRKRPRTRPGRPSEEGRRQFCSHWLHTNVRGLIGAQTGRRSTSPPLDDLPVHFEYLPSLGSIL